MTKDENTKRWLNHLVTSVKDFTDPWHRVKAYNPVGRYFEFDATCGKPEEVQSGGVYGYGSPTNADIYEWFYSRFKTHRRRTVLRAMRLSI